MVGEPLPVRAAPMSAAHLPSTRRGTVPAAAHDARGAGLGGESHPQSAPAVAMTERYAIDADCAPPRRMKVAIIGSGIAAKVVAHHLHRDHDITVFEAVGHVGGHTDTHTIEMDGESHEIDTDF